MRPASSEPTSNEIPFLGFDDDDLDLAEAAHVAKSRKIQAAIYACHYDTLPSDLISQHNIPTVEEAEARNRQIEAAFRAKGGVIPAATPAPSSGKKSGKISTPKQSLPVLSKKPAKPAQVLPKTQTHEVEDDDVSTVVTKTSGRRSKPTEKALEMLEEKKRAKTPKSTPTSTPRATPVKDIVSSGRRSGKETREHSLEKDEGKKSVKKPSKTAEAKAELGGPEEKASSKQLIRPSKLGSFSSSPPLSNSFSSPVNTTPTGPAPKYTPSMSHLFGVTPGALIVEGKRHSKPSLRLQEAEGGTATPSGSGTGTPTKLMKKSITQYADAMTSKKEVAGSSSGRKEKKVAKAKNEEKVEDEESKDEMQEKIQRMLASQWDSRLRKVENKFVKTSR